MKKRFFAAKKGNVFRRKSDGVEVGRFVIDTTIENYEEVVDKNPMHRRTMSPRELFPDRRVRVKK
jgi:hypothetical protein